MQGNVILPRATSKFGASSATCVLIIMTQTDFVAGKRALLAAIVLYAALHIQAGFCCQLSVIVPIFTIVTVI